MKLLFRLLMGVMAFSFLSCEKDAMGVKQPPGIPKVVVYSFISPHDNEIIVHIANSKPVFGTYDKAHYGLENAIVRISDGESSAELSLFESNPQFAREGIDMVTDTVYTFLTKPEEFAIVAERTYYLTVHTADGRKAESFCTVPAAAPKITGIVLDSAETTITRDGETIKGQDYYFSCFFEDLPRERNYYRLTGSTTTWFWNATSSGTETHEGPFRFNTLFTDDGRDGNKLYFTKRYFTSVFEKYFDENLIEQRPSLGYLLLYATDRHYYEYHSTLQRIDWDIYNLNPFAEPVFVYSNVKGGLGVFAAYNRSSISFSY